MAIQSQAQSCQTTTTTVTHEGTGVNSIVITSEGELEVTVEESELFQATITFDGRDNVNDVLSDSSSQSTSNFTIWNIDVMASAPTNPPSSANSQIFFSDATSAVMSPLAGILAGLLVEGSCAEAATVVLSLPAGWLVSDQGAKRVVVDSAGPMAYGYDLTITLPDYSTDTWTEDDAAALVSRLLNFYGDPNLLITVTATVNSDGGLVLTVNVLGFTTLVGATASYNFITSNGIVFTDSSASSSSQFRGMHVSASAPGISCQTGFSTDSAGICVDTDGCLDNACGNGLCVDAVAPENGYSCACYAGYYDNHGNCTNIDGCVGNTCGTDGACVDVAPPGTGFTCNCDSGYVSVDLVCVNEPGCANSPVSCSISDVSGTCIDVAPPGTGYSCSCGTGNYVDTRSPSAPTCTYIDCGSPSAQTGYTVLSGTTYYGSTRSSNCASGYSGTPTTRTCRSDGTWTSSTGCSLNCSTSPTQTGYTISAGSSNQGATRTVTCASGYSGTASAVTCGTNSAWSTSSGCTLNCSTSPTFTGYTVASGASNQGATRTTSCASGYTGSGSQITCGTNAAWSSPTGCTYSTQSWSYPNFSGWSDRRTTCCSNYCMMGGYNTFGAGACTSVSLGSLSAGTYYVRFNFYHVDSWDGESAQMYWNNNLMWSRAHSLGGSDLCGGGWGESNGMFGQTLQTVSHGGGAATLMFCSSLDQDPSDESWGVNAISVGMS